MDFLAGIQTAAEWLGSIFSRLWGVIASWPFVACAVLMPFVFWILCRVVRLVQNASRFDVAEWSDSGLVGVVKRHKERQEEKRRKALPSVYSGRMKTLMCSGWILTANGSTATTGAAGIRCGLGIEPPSITTSTGTRFPVYDGKRQTGNGATVTIPRNQERRPTIWKLPALWRLTSQPVSAPLSRTWAR